MKHIETDILVIGGGLAGLAATARLAATGARAVCVDPAPADSAGSDLRTTAFLTPAISTLTTAGAWSGMETAGAPLWTMRIVDAGGRERMVRETCDFNAREMQETPFGWNIPNRTARRALIDRIAAAGSATLVAKTRVTHLLRRTSGVTARLSDGTAVKAKLVVAADGRNSNTRETAGIGVKRWHYAQRALVFAVTHEVPHDGTSTEIHRTGGPLTLVPMPDLDGSPCSSVVWMVPGPRAVELAAMEDAPLERILNGETMGLFGDMTIIGDRAVWPIIGQMTEALTAGRLALIGETAHVIPPIGAQGLNISLGDVEMLAELVADALASGTDFGATELLDRYARGRWPEMAVRVAGVDILNRFAQAEAQPVRDLRQFGLKVIHDLNPLRRAAMQLGMGARARHGR